MDSQSNESNLCQLCKASQSKHSWTENPGMFFCSCIDILIVCKRINSHLPGFYFHPSTSGEKCVVDKIHRNTYAIKTCTHAYDFH